MTREEIQALIDAAIKQERERIRGAIVGCFTMAQAQMTQPFYGDSEFRFERSMTSLAHDLDIAIQDLE